MRKSIPQTEEEIKALALNFLEWFLSVITIIKGMNWIADSQRPTETGHPLYIISKIREVKDWGVDLVDWYPRDTLTYITVSKYNE